MVRKVAELNYQLSGQKWGHAGKCWPSVRRIAGRFCRPCGICLLNALPRKAFWDAFEQILPEAEQDVPLEQDPPSKGRLDRKQNFERHFLRPQTLHLRVRLCRAANEKGARY
jgi:hypothetical protein